MISPFIGQWAGSELVTKQELGKAWFKLHQSEAWSLANHFLPLSLFSFTQLLTWPLVCHFWKAAMSLCPCSTKHSCAPNTRRPWGTSQMQHGKIHCAPDRAVCYHPASPLLHTRRNPLQNHRTICRTGHYSEWVNVTEFLQLFTFHQHLRAYKKQKVLWQAPPGWMDTRRVHMLHHKEPDLFCPPW